MKMESVSNIMCAAGKGSKHDEEMAAHSLVLLSHNSARSKKMMKTAKEFQCEKRSSYNCKTCGKGFLSFHALGGHRSSCCNTTNLAETEEAKEKGSSKMRVHECPICWRVFSSGQALGGHKRTHSTPPPPMRSSARENAAEQRAELDLNLPAPLEMEDVSIPAISDYGKYNPGLHCWMDGYGKRLRIDYTGAVAFEAESRGGGDLDFKPDILMVATL